MVGWDQAGSHGRWAQPLKAMAAGPKLSPPPPLIPHLPPAPSPLRTMRQLKFVVANGPGDMYHWYGKTMAMMASYAYDELSTIKTGAKGVGARDQGLHAFWGGGHTSVRGHAVLCAARPRTEACPPP